MIEGLSHITLIVQDLERSATLLRTVFDAQEIYDSHAQPFSLAREKFFIVAGQWIVLMEGAALPTRSYNHIAFKLRPQALDEAIARIRQLGLEILPGRQRVEGEGRSVYFYDADNHLFELHDGTLGQRLRRYAQAPLQASGG